MNLEEKMKNGKLYNCSFGVMEKELTDRLNRCRELLYDFNLSRPSEEEKRDALLREVLAEAGENLYIEPPLHANWGCNTHVGKNFYANFNLTLVDDADIFIGDDCMFAPNVIIATGTHPVLPELRRRVYQYNLPVRIGNCVWLGAGSIVLPGVTIGDNTVVGAGSVVTKDLPANVVAVGNPAKILREIGEYDRQYYHKNLKIEKEEL